MLVRRMNLRTVIREFPDFPEKGVLFRDISPLLKSASALNYIVERFHEHFKVKRVDVIAGIESRGFIIASALAMRFGCGMVMIRKQGKLPGRTRSIDYTIEYGKATMEIQEDAVSAGDNVLIADDLIATGGTASAAARLVEGLGARVAGFAFVIELARLKGRELLKGYDVCSLVVYDE
ncbi:MAG: adenine phosphoribosyltransferase [Candidatus Nitrosocaldus sp.]|nr:adenine phosphoribosyltransferase [Candidatus Nitrosocaldus sp.]